MIRALIIEDDPMVARFNAIYLESITGFTVVGQARSADEGRKILSETKVDLLLLDVYIGKTTGLDFLIELRKGNNPVDVIVITAANDKESVQTALRYGAVDYLIKPLIKVKARNMILVQRQKKNRAARIHLPSLSIKKRKRHIQMLN